MKLITKLVKFIIGTLIFAIILSLILLGLLHKPLKEIEGLADYEISKLEDYIYDEFDSNLNEDIEIKIDERYINNFLEKELKKVYSSNDIENINFTGPYISKEQEDINITLGLNFNYSNLNFKTQVKIKMNSNNEEESIIFKIKNIKIGNLPFNIKLKQINKVVFNKTGKTLNELIINNFEKMLEVNIENNQFIISKNELIEKLLKSDETLITLYNIVENNEIAKIDYKDKNIIINLKTKKLLNLDIEEYFKYESITNINKFYENKVKESNIWQGIISKEGKIKFNSEETNKLINYYLDQYKEKLSIDNDKFSFGIISTYTDLKNSSINVLFNLRQNEKDIKLLNLDINSMFSLEKINDNLIINIKDFNLGSLDINSADKEKLLKELLEDNNIILENLFEYFSQNKINITNVSVENNDLIFDYKIEIEEDLKELLDVIKEIDGLPENLKEKADEIIQLLEEENEVQEYIEGLIEDLNSLPEDKQKDIMDKINFYMNNII